MRRALAVGVVLGLVGAAEAQPAPAPAPTSGCLGVAVEACVRSLQTSMAVDSGAIADALARRNRVDVNGRRLGSGLVSITATLPGRLSPVVIVLHLAADDRVASVETTLLSDPAHARTEAEYDRTALYDMTARLLGTRCGEIAPMPLYRFFENTVKPRIKSRREDIRGGLFGGHKLFNTAQRVPLCGASFTYGALFEWSGADDPDFARNVRGFYTIRFE